MEYVIRDIFQRPPGALADQDAVIFYADYPTEPISDENPYSRCCVCKRSVPEINGRLEGHAKGCAWAEQKKRELALARKTS